MSIFTMETFMTIINTQINIYKLINTHSKIKIPFITIKIITKYTIFIISNY